MDGGRRGEVCVLLCVCVCVCVCLEGKRVKDVSTSRELSCQLL